MDDLKIYEEKKEQNIKRNEKYIKEFEEWLNGKSLAKKTVRKHINNVDLYINAYLNYYDISLMENGVHYVCSFLNGWFIEKCLWASENSIKETAKSIKRFYQCMSEKGYIKVDDYKSLCTELKDNMDEFLYSLKRMENGTYYDMFDL